MKFLALLPLIVSAALTSFSSGDSIEASVSWSANLDTSSGAIWWKQVLRFDTEYLIGETKLSSRTDNMTNVEWGLNMKRYNESYCAAKYWVGVSDPWTTTPRHYRTQATYTMRPQYLNCITAEDIKQSDATDKTANSATIGSLFDISSGNELEIISAKRGLASSEGVNYANFVWARPMMGYPILRVGNDF